MDQHTPDIAFARPGWRDRLDQYLVAQGQGFNAHLETRARLHEFVALDAKTDAELAELGLTRREVPAFVFADMLGSVRA
jgi:hypothetical protein